MGATRRSQRKLVRHGLYGGVRRLHQREIRRHHRELAKTIQALETAQKELGFTPVDDEGQE